MAATPAYISTPIYYVNDRPHIGHVYTTTLCDVWARFKRFDGADVFFLTGTDEHGVKVEKSARERGVEPKALADENSAVFRSLMSRLGLTFDHFIRTTDEEHERQVRLVVTRLLEKDAVYLGTFEGWYDEGQEEYHTETQAQKLEYVSPVNGRPLVRAQEKNYYFRLSAFQKPLEKLFAEHPDFVRPEGRRNEVLGRLREGLQDVPMSRTNFTWGIPMPDDPQHVIYVWIDALLNYITALGLMEPESEQCAERAHYWPPTYHVIGKEILWFHAVIWPAMLISLELPLPRCIYAHSFWIREGQKMSKSLGNFIDLETIDRYIEAYGGDLWRYYLVCHGPHGSTDADFAARHVHDVFSADLVNTVGNCASRVTAMVNKYFDGVVPPDSPAAEGGPDWAALTAGVTAEVRTSMDNFDLAGAVGAAMGLVRQIDAYINETAPFKIAKEPGREAELGAILARCIEAVRIASLLLWPVMPERMETLWEALGITVDPRGGELAKIATWGDSLTGRTVTKVALFPRLNWDDLAPELEPAPA